MQHFECSLLWHSIYGFAGAVQPFFEEYDAEYGSTGPSASLVDALVKEDVVEGDPSVSIVKAGPIFKRKSTRTKTNNNKH